MNKQNSSLETLHDVARTTLEASHPNGWGETKLVSGHVSLSVAGVGDREGTKTDVTVDARDQVGAKYRMYDETERFGDNPPHGLLASGSPVIAERRGYGDVEIKNPRAKEIVRMRAARVVGKALVEDAQKKLDRASSVVNKHGLLDK